MYSIPNCGADNCKIGQCDPADRTRCIQDQCLPGYISDSGLCIRCPNNCDICTLTGVCSSCIAPTVLSGGVCVCPSGVINKTVKPWTCSTAQCPDRCLSCSSADLCTDCKSEFRLVASACECMIDQGFKLLTDTICGACKNGCKSCSDSTSLCSGTECRTGYINFPDCTCPTSDGFKEEASVAQGYAETCVPCAA